MCGDKMMTKEEMITAAKMIEIEMITLEPSTYVRKSKIRHTIKVCAEAAHDIAKTLEENRRLLELESMANFMDELGVDR